MIGIRMDEPYSRRATRLVVLAVALALLTQAILVMTARAQARDLVCGSEFDGNVFDGGWSRSATDILSGSGLLTIPSNGPIDDWAALPCALIGPFEIEVRARIVSGGQNYVSPFIEGYAADQTVLNVVVLPDGASSCQAGPASHGWLVEAGPGSIGINQWTKSIPNAVACEGQWMTMRVVVAGGETAASTRLLDAEAFLPGHAVSNVPGPITQFHLRQPWDAHIEIDYVRLYALDADVAGVVREEGKTTRGQLNGTEGLLVAEHNATRAHVTTAHSKTRGIISADLALTRGLVNASRDHVVGQVIAEHDTTRAHVTEEHDMTRSVVSTVGSAVLSTLASLKTWLSTQFDDVHERFDQADEDHLAVLDGTDRILREIGHATDTTPLIVTITPSAKPGVWYALVTLRGEPVDAAVEASWQNSTLDATPAGPTGLYVVDAATLPPSVDERALVVAARRATHAGAALVLAPPGTGTNVTLPQGPTPAAAGPTTEVVLFERTVTVENATYGAPGSTVSLAHVEGSSTPDGRYQLDVTIGGEAPTSVTLPRDDGIPDIDREILLETEAHELALPGAAVHVRVFYRAEADRPLDEEAPAWLLGDGPARAVLVVHAEARDGTGAVLESRELEVPLAGQAIGWMAGAVPTP